MSIIKALGVDGPELNSPLGWAKEMYRWAEQAGRLFEELKVDNDWILPRNGIVWQLRLAFPNEGVYLMKLLELPGGIQHLVPFDW